MYFGHSEGNVECSDSYRRDDVARDIVRVLAAISRGGKERGGSV